MWFSTFQASAAITALAAVTNALPQPSTGVTTAKRATACNNSPDLCSKKYDEVTYLGAHNSYALRDDSTNDAIGGNQYLNATKALDAGLRLLQVQTNKGNTTLELCHTDCGILDAGPLEDFLVKINDWMDSNPNEVVTMVAVNSNSEPASTFNSALQKSGIGKRAYEPSGGDTAPSSWPTLQKMIDDDKRFVFFVTNADYSSSAPAVLPEFDFVFETPFEVSEINGFNCTADRPSQFNGDGAQALQSNYLSLVNHFKYQSLNIADLGITIPDVDTIKTVNSAGTSKTGELGKHLEQCKKQWSKVPNFVLIDFWNEADPIKAVDSMNNVKSATGRTTASQGKSGSSGTSAAWRVGADGVGFGALVAFVSAAIVLV